MPLYYNLRHYDLWFGGEFGLDGPFTQRRQNQNRNRLKKIKKKIPKTKKAKKNTQQPTTSVRKHFPETWLWVEERLK